jgi:polyisoprenoid-binding protein YceI
VYRGIKTSLPFYFYFFYHNLLERELKKTLLIGGFMFQKILTFITLVLTFLSSSVLLANTASKTWTLSQEESKIQWTGSKKTGSSHSGLIKLESGSVTLESEQIKSGTLVIDMTSLEVTDIPKESGRNAQLADHLKDEDFFNVKAYPKARLVIKSSKKTKGSLYEVVTDLTIRDTTQTLTIPLTLTIKDSKAQATGKIKIDRTKFGVKYGSANFFKLAADRIINDDFEIDFTIIAKP